MFMQKAPPPISTKRQVPKEERTTTPYLTKFERARILGARALQLRFFIAFLIPLNRFFHLFNLSGL